MIFASPRDLYFAYGSNMSSNHMISRIRSAKVVGAATLEGYIWCCNKLGRDGSAKANIMQQQGEVVHGVLYSIRQKHWKRLDQIENGYHRIEVEVESAGERHRVYTYQSDLLTSQPPAELYLSQIIDGLIEHQMPVAYVRELRREAGI